MSTQSQPAVLALKPDKAAQILGRHPWVRATSLAGTPPETLDGAVVDVCDHRGRFLGRGIYNSRSRIAVRLYDWDGAADLNDAFFVERLRTAIVLRRGLGWDNPDAAIRLAFSEADALSGLVVDRYGPYIVIQVTARAMLARTAAIVRFLESEYSPASILLRTDPRIAAAEGMEARDEVAAGAAPTGDVHIVEHGVKIAFDLMNAQKTGLYLDQRENRRAAAGYAAGRRVLDVCCYVGGFGLTAAVVGQARHVDFVDASAKAIEQARRNAEVNGVAEAGFHVADAFDFLDQQVAARAQYDMVVLDPPRFAGSRRQIDAALAAYHRLNRLALALLQPGGVLVTSSCSGHVDRSRFGDMLKGACRRSHRDLQILEERGAAADHPVRLSCPETHYLKCLIGVVR